MKNHKLLLLETVFNCKLMPVFNNLQSKTLFLASVKVAFSVAANHMCSLVNTQDYCNTVAVDSLMYY